MHRGVVLISPREVRKVFSCQEWALMHLHALHCKFQMYEDCGLGATFLAQLDFAHEHVIRTYTEGILDRGFVPMPFGFRQSTVLRAEEARPGVAT